MIKLKSALLLLVVFLCQQKSFGQSPIINKTDNVSTGTSTFSIDVNTANTGLGQLIAPDDFRQRGVKRTLPFIEYGDGAFSTLGTSSHVMGRQNYPTYLFATALYDTTRPKAATRLASLPKSSTALNFSTNDQPLLATGKSIMLNSNVGDIVQGDYNNFVLTYKLPDSAIPVQYRIVVLYNNNPVFNDINKTDKLDNGADRIRLFYGDVLSSASVNSTMLRKVKSDPLISFQKGFTVDCGQITFTERNLFFTSYTDPNVELNSVTSLYAVLIGSTDNWVTWTKIDDYLINSMPVAIAHDPNYIAQTGRCILLPKAEKVIKYHVHFQNDGKGQAGQVDVKIKLPPGINNTNIKFGSANCGGNIYQLTKENTHFDDDNYTLTISFRKQGERPLLMGTDGNINPLINPNTMGDIFFNVSETVITSDTLPAYADIFFYNLNSDVALPAIRTNLAASVYRVKCDGSNIVVNCDTAKIWHNQQPCKNCNPTCYTLFSICWYWWLLLIPIFWIIYRLYRKDKRDTNYQSGV